MQKSQYQNRWRILLTILGAYILITGVILYTHLMVMPLAQQPLLILSSCGFWLMISARACRVWQKYLTKQWQARDLGKRALAVDTQLGIYEAAKPVLSTAGPKSGQAILFLHGFSSSPQDFSYLLKAIDQIGLPYSCPLITGFGSVNQHTLNHIQPQDWIRHALEAYDNLAVRAHRISIVGFSGGAALAAHVASMRPVDKLLLLAPYLYVRSLLRKCVFACLNAHVIGRIIKYLLPAMIKEQNPNLSNRVENTILPTQSVAALHTLVRTINYAAIRPTSLHVIYGKKDKLMRPAKCQKILAAAPVDASHQVFEQLGHTLLIEPERQALINTIVAYLSTPPENTANITDQIHSISS